MVELMCTLCWNHFLILQFHHKYHKAIYLYQHLVHLFQTKFHFKVTLLNLDTTTSILSDTEEYLLVNI